MADEKNLDNEILDDEELDGVAGGTFKETFDDRAKLDKLGLYNFDERKGFAGSVKEGFDALGKRMGITINVKSSPSVNDSANVYQIENHTFTREEFWSIINETATSRK